MCKCTPEIRTPFCGRGDCLPPGYANERIDGWKREFQKVQAKRDAYRERAEQAEARVAELEAALRNEMCARHQHGLAFDKDCFSPLRGSDSRCGRLRRAAMEGR